MRKETVLMPAMVLKVSLVLILLFSCKENNNINTKNNSLKEIKSIENEFKFVFPDTVVMNEKYQGKILYKGILDTLTTKLGTGDKVSRYIIYNYIKTDLVSNNISEIEGNSKLKRVAGLQYDYIDLLNISFSNKGVYYLDGFIRDEVHLEVLNSDKVRQIVNKTRAVHKVVVIDTIRY